MEKILANPGFLCYHLPVDEVKVIHGRRDCHAEGQKEQKQKNGTDNQRYGNPLI